MPNYEKKFSRIYNKNLDKIYRFIFLKIGNKETTQDVTSLVFAKFLDKLKDGAQELDNERAYLYQIARAEIANHYRYQARYKTVSSSGLEIEDQDSINPEKAQQLNQDILVLRQCLADLKEEEQTIVILRYVEEMPFKKIAKIVGKEPGSVRVINHRALKQLKEKMQNI